MAWSPTWLPEDEETRLQAKLSASDSAHVSAKPIPPCTIIRSRTGSYAAREPALMSGHGVNSDGVTLFYAPPPWNVSTLGRGNGFPEPPYNTTRSRTGS